MGSWPRIKLSTQVCLLTCLRLGQLCPRFLPLDLLSPHPFRPGQWYICTLWRELSGPKAFGDSNLKIALSALKVYPGPGFQEHTPFPIIHPSITVRAFCRSLFEIILILKVSLPQLLTDIFSTISFSTKYLHKFFFLNMDTFREICIFSSSDNSCSFALLDFFT